MMRLIKMICVLSLTFSLATAGQVSEALPTLDQVLDRYVQALGGKAAFEKLTTRVVVQSEVRPDGEAKVEIYEKAPNRRLIRTTLADASQIEAGFDGRVGWIKNPDGEVREITGQELAVLKQGAEFHREVKLKELFPKLALKGEEKIEGRPTYLVEAPAAGGGIVKMYFDARSGLLVRKVQPAVALIRQSDEEEPQAKLIDLEFNFEDYREVGGVKLPFSITRRGPLATITIKVKEVKYNVAVEDAKFKKPTP